MLAVTAAGCFSGSDYAAGLASRGASVMRMTAIAEVTAAVVLVAVVPFASSRSLGAVVGLGALPRVDGVVGAMALHLVFRYAALSVASSVSAVRAAAFSVLAGLLFGQRPSALALVGIVLALPAIAAVSVSADPVSTRSAAEGGSSVAGGNGATDPPGQPRRSALGRLPRGGGGVGVGCRVWAVLIGLNRAGSGDDLWPLVAAELTGVVTVRRHRGCHRAARAAIAGLPDVRRRVTTADRWPPLFKPPSVVLRVSRPVMQLALHINRIGGHP
jgi:hypothetical protein